MTDLSVGRLTKAVAPTRIADSLVSESGGAVSVNSLLHVYGDLSLHGRNSGTLALRAPAAAGTSVITFPVGTTDLSFTGGTGHVLQQPQAGGRIVVAPMSVDLLGLAGGVPAFLKTPTSANLDACITDDTGNGALVFNTGPILVTPRLESPTLVGPVIGVATGTSLAVTGSLTAGPNGSIGWADDTQMQRNAQGVIAMRNGANPQQLMLYNSYTDVADGEWAYLGSWFSGVSRLGTGMNGTGLARPVALLVGNSEKARFEVDGSVGIGIADAHALLHLGGTYNSVDPYLERTSSIFVSSVTATQIGLSKTPTFAPSGASVNTIWGALFQPQIDGTTTSAIAEFAGIGSQLVIQAGFGGTIPLAVGFAATTPINPGQPFLDYYGFQCGAITNGNGAASGIIANRGLSITSTSASSAGATINNRGVHIGVPAGGASAGLATNYGLYLTGNGGVASGSGTVVNYSLFSDSTALSILRGLRVGLATGAANATNAVEPFLYITAAPGAPTGVPRDATGGSIAITWDSIAKKLMVYDHPSSSWKGVVLS